MSLCGTASHLLWGRSSENGCISNSENGNLNSSCQMPTGEDGHIGGNAAGVCLTGTKRPSSCSRHTTEISKQKAPGIPRAWYAGSFLREIYRCMLRRRSGREQAPPGVHVMRSVRRAGDDLYDHQSLLGTVQAFIPLPVANLGQIHTVVAQ